MIPLSQALAQLEKQGLRLYRNHLARRTLPGPSGQPESLLERLAREEMAISVDHGQRRLWYVTPSAISRLADVARSARPGPSPGAQVTLDAQQLTVFARYLAESTDPAASVKAAAAAATGLDAATIERVVIPATPRHPGGGEAKRRGRR